MYNYLNLSKIPYFEEYHDSIDDKPLDADLSNVLDALTGVVSRRYIEGYVRYLISKKVKFTYVISDLDNFKQINDNYGHSLGDIVLKTISSSLIQYVGDKGVVGRYGGDEFVMLLNGNYEYDDIHEFINGMYYNNTVYRRYCGFGSVCPFVTSTIGSVKFPDDGENYEELFINMDKALYRGKMKGRNCFIIFNKEQHGDIDISRMKKRSMYEMITTISGMLRENINPDDRINDSLNYIEKAIRVDGAVLIDNDYYCEKLGIKFPEEIFNNFDSNGMTSCTDRVELEGNSKVFKFLEQNRILSFILVKVMYAKNELYGYLFVLSRTTQHIWQDEELALTYYLSELIGIVDKHTSKKFKFTR